MAGYTRQNSADITSGSTVRAAPINNELNQVRDAFSEATGHKHDGTTAEGPVIDMIGDSGGTAINKVQIDGTNDRVSFFSALLIAVPPLSPIMSMTGPSAVVPSCL
jgi:hypothetical protein